MKQLATLVLFSCLVASSPAVAQLPEKAGPATPQPRPHRLVYPLKNADAAALAEVVGAHFQDEVKVLAAPPAAGNALLLSGPGDAVAEVVKLLDLLDRTPKSVEIEVTIADVPAKKDGAELSPADLATAEAAIKAGQGRRIKLTGLDGRPVSSTTGGDRPFVSGTTVVGGGGRGQGFGGGPPGNPGGGPVQRSISYRSVGTTVKATPSVGADGAVTLELSVQDNRHRAPEGDEDVGGAPSFETGTLTTKVVIPAGRTVAAQTIRVEGKGKASVAVVLVSARVVEAPVPTAKRR